MFKHISRGRVIGAWCSAVVLIGACSVVAGAAVTLSNAELWLVACLMPPTVLLFVWRGAPPATVAELLHSVDAPSDESRS